MLSRWHPTLAIRYLPMLKFIDSKDSVLEVGSGSLGIGPYLKREFTGLDIDFDGPDWPKMEKVKGSATNLPFKNKTFDVVINSDMLEHLPKNKRQKAINEMVRVCKKTLIIGVPIGKKAHQQDKILDKLYLSIHGKRHPFLKEQTEFGLPKSQDIVSSIKNSTKNKNINIKILPNMNLNLRMWLMKGWISKNFLVNVFFRKILLVAIPILRLFNNHPVYRRIFIVRLDN